MIPSTGTGFQSLQRIPRESGDDPLSHEKEFIVLMYSPRERG